MNREWFKNRANQKYGYKCKKYIDTDEVNKENTEKRINHVVNSIILLMDIMSEMNKRLKELEKLIIKERSS